MFCYYMGKSDTIRDALKNSSDPHVQGMGLSVFETRIENSKSI